MCQAVDIYSKVSILFVCYSDSFCTYYEFPCRAFGSFPQTCISDNIKCDGHCDCLGACDDENKKMCKHFTDAMVLYQSDITVFCQSDVMVLCQSDVMVCCQSDVMEFW